MVCDTCRNGPLNNGTEKLCSDDCTNFGGYEAIAGVIKLCTNCGRLKLVEGACIRIDSCNKNNKLPWIPKF
jgi:hypothetical protein